MTGTEFLGNDVLLSNPTARRLYREFAETVPIVDVHNHLPPEEIADDHVWATLTDVWLGGDHYKWRAMRLAGVPEHLITGPADPWDRFEAWAATMPRMIRNPLHLWSHLELKRAFGIDLALSPSTAREIWDEADRQLPELGARAMLRHFDVELVATTDEPSSRLEHHTRLAANEDAGLRMVPTFRPDRAHALLGDPERWNRWIDGLVAVGDAAAIDDLGSLLGALTSSYRRMAAAGCRASDHGLARLPDRPRNPEAADRAVAAARDGRPASDDERELVLLEVVALAARLAFADDAVLQIHLGPMRDASPRLLAAVGHDAGSDVMGDERQAPGLVRFLGDLEADDSLPRTVLYNLNPADNALLVTMAGAFARPGVPGLVQWGPPWWFNDHEVGMRRHLDDLSQIGQLGSFIGMLTDSRSMLSMTRHEMFRRILCDVIGRDVEAGTVPGDIDALGQLVRDVSVDNARRFFGFE